jgi:uncharacterized protein (TIGR03067 family)
MGLLFALLVAGPAVLPITPLPQERGITEIDGTWIREPVSQIGRMRLELVIHGTHFNLTRYAYRERTITFSGKPSPRAFTIKDVGAENDESGNNGICEVEKDSIKTAYFMWGGRTPKSFDDRGTAPLMVEIWRRADLPEGEASGKGPTVIQGALLLVDRTVNGVRRFDPAAEYTNVTIVGNRWIRRVVTCDYGTIAIDPAKSPKSIDYHYLSGTYKGLDLPGIYAVEGDVMTEAHALPGGSRPTGLDEEPNRATSWRRLRP